jgi:hypothetical protein
MDATDHARQTVAAEFSAAGRNDFKEYIDTALAGDFAYALAGILARKSEGPTRRALDMAQRAIDELRRYVFDNTADRRLKRAEHCQESLDALSRTLGIEPTHKWPRETWVSDHADVTLVSLERDAASLLSRIDIASANPADTAAETLTAAKEFVLRALADAHEQRRALTLMERALQIEETESQHWAEKSTVDGDLGANPPTFLADVVADLKKELEEVKAERDEHARVREKLRRDYLDVYDRLLQAEAKL